MRKSSKNGSLSISKDLVWPCAVLKDAGRAGSKPGRQDSLRSWEARVLELASCGLGDSWAKARCHLPRLFWEQLRTALVAALREVVRVRFPWHWRACPSGRQRRAASPRLSSSLCLATEIRPCLQKLQ